MTHEPTQTPWHVVPDTFGENLIAGAEPMQLRVASVPDDADAALIVQAVNERAALLAERAELQFKLAHKVSEVDRLTAERAELMAEVARLKAAWDKCATCRRSGLLEAICQGCKYELGRREST